MIVLRCASQRIVELANGFREIENNPVFSWFPTRVCVYDVESWPLFHKGWQLFSTNDLYSIRGQKILQFVIVHCLNTLRD